MKVCYLNVEICSYNEESGLKMESWFQEVWVIDNRIFE